MTPRRKITESSLSGVVGRVTTLRTRPTPTRPRTANRQTSSEPGERRSSGARTAAALFVDIDPPVLYGPVTSPELRVPRRARRGGGSADQRNPSGVHA